MNQLITANTPEQRMKMISITKLVYLNGAIWTMPAIPNTKSAKNKANTMTAIVNAVMQSPFSTVDTPEVGWTAVMV